jgi:hypothetical protein
MYLRVRSEFFFRDYALFRICLKARSSQLEKQQTPLAKKHKFDFISNSPSTPVKQQDLISSGSIMSVRKFMLKIKSKF